MSRAQADEVWNRAALANGGTCPLTGDEALELQAALRGYRFFGLENVAALLLEPPETEDDSIAADR